MMNQLVSKKCDMKKKYYAPCEVSWSNSATAAIKLMS